MQLASSLLLILVLLIKVSCFSPHSSLSACHSRDRAGAFSRCGVVGPRFDVLLRSISYLVFHFIASAKSIMSYSSYILLALLLFSRTVRAINLVILFTYQCQHILFQ